MSEQSEESGGGANTGETCVVKQLWISSIGRKLVMGASGLALVGFTVVHLLGNLTLFAPNAEVFNTYAMKLHDLGPLLQIAEVGLIVFFLAHIFTALKLRLGNQSARPQGYRQWQTKGNPSYANMSSLYMIVSGVLLLLFVVVHLKHFHFGPTMAEGYVTDINGRAVRDLHRLVQEVFSDPINVGFYVVCMLMLGHHLRHGFWSALHSLGVARPSATRRHQLIALVLAAVLSLGFLAIPLWMWRQS